MAEAIFIENGFSYKGGGESRLCKCFSFISSHYMLIKTTKESQWIYSLHSINREQKVLNSFIAEQKQYWAKSSTHWTCISI